LYRVFLFAYPPRLRDEFGLDMMSVFEQQLADTIAPAGVSCPVVLFHAAMNTFPQVLPWSPPMIGLLLVWVVWVVIADRMWRRNKIANGAHEARTQHAVSRSAV